MTISPRVRHFLPLSLFASISALSLCSLATSRQGPSSDSEVHLYHQEPPQGPLPPIVDPKEFDNVVVRNAYTLAAKLAPVLYQEPCYCHCSRYLGHASLLDCYTSRHTAGCPICLQEVFFIHEQTVLGRTPAEIRERLAHGDWKAVNLKGHETPLAHDSKSQQ